MYYTLDGHTPVRCTNAVEWANWYETANETRRVAEDNVGEARISTVFLGLDHAFNPNMLPILFETLIFGGPHHGEGKRYTTWDEAVEGHKKMVELVGE